MTAFNHTTLRLWFASVLVPFTMMVICKDWERSKQSKLLKGKTTGQTLLHRFMFFVYKLLNSKYIYIGFIIKETSV